MTTDLTQPASLASAPAGRGALAGRYQLQELIGRGGMAEVYRATDTLLRRDVAVKIFHGGSARPEEAARQQAEVNLLAQLTHPGLVALYDAGVEGEDLDTARSYMVLELVDGITLGRRLLDGPIPADEVAALGAQMAEALGYVHRRNVVHRDIKPANILLSATGDPGFGVVAKVTDFGVARLLDGGQRMTTQGVTIGTANYLSPEQAQGLDVGAASDVYSLGLVLIECLTGVRAFPGHGVEAALTRLRRGPYIPAALGPVWGQLLAAMTADDPDARPDALAVTRSLRELELGSPAVPAGPVTALTTQLGPLPGLLWSDDFPPAVAASNRPSARIWLAVAAAVIVTVVAVSVGVLLNRSSGNVPTTESPGTGPVATSSVDGAPRPVSGTDATSTTTSVTPVAGSVTPAGPAVPVVPVVPAVGNSPVATPTPIATPTPTKKAGANGNGNGGKAKNK